jgi:uncharacterized protein (TIGR02231 family)
MARHEPREIDDKAPIAAAGEPVAPGATDKEAEGPGARVRAVDLPIVTVTLLEDRAHVVRRGSLALGRAGERVRVERIAPVASDKTLAVSVVEGSGVTVIDARIRRRAVVRLRDADAAPSDVGAEREALERQRDELHQTLGALRSEREVSSRHGAALERASVLALAELAEDVSWGINPEAAWAERLDELAREQTELGRRQVDMDREAERLEATLERLGQRIATLDGPAEEERADLEIDLQGPAGAGCELRVDYAVPGACWRPCHTVRLGDAGDGSTEGRAAGRAEVEIDTDACVWQNTGEDWRDVELVLSTERVSLGVEPPHLSSDILRAVKRSDQVVVEAREQEIDTTGLGMGEGAGRAVSPELPGIDDGGQVQTWRAAERAIVPSDGRPYRVRLGSFRSEAEVELVAFPELSPSVLLKSTQENRGSGPLLAGPVDLVRASGLCGRTSIRYVAPGERFELGWGADADLRVSREVEALDEKSRMLSAWSVRRTLVRVKLSNLGGEARRLSVTERVPISEVEKVRVSVDSERVTGGRRPDENGFLRWSVSLAPFGHEELELVWELRRHEDVVGV